VVQSFRFAGAYDSIYIFSVEDDTLNLDISNINKKKAVFDDIYSLGDPRSYFSVLGALDYMIPDVAESVVRQILEARAALYDDDPAHVLDIGCSYGINAAVHRFPVNFGGLCQRYARREMMELPSSAMIRLDRHFYAAWPQTGIARFIGLDRSEPAVHYASEVGLHDAGVAANLEQDDLTRRDAATIAPANVLLSTGAVGYVTDTTFGKVLDALPRTPWIISFVLRLFPYDSFASSFAARGMTTERLSGTTFVQRRFRDAEELENTLAALAARGIDTQGFEADGLFHAELFLSRPREDAVKMPLDEIVTVSSGRFRSFGSRFVHVEGSGGSHVAIEA